MNITLASVWAESINIKRVSVSRVLALSKVMALNKKSNQLGGKG
jgi:hypothetical protein